MDKFIKDYKSKSFSFSYNADNNDGTYTNPIIHTDFSDPDVICVGDDYFMTAFVKKGIESFHNHPWIGQ